MLNTGYFFLIKCHKSVTGAVVVRLAHVLEHIELWRSSVQSEFESSFQLYMYTTSSSSLSAL